MSSILTLDDMEFYVNPQSPDSDSFGAKLLQIAAELPQWDDEWQKMNSDILKLRKRIDVGASTIESVLPGILEQLGYPYYTERVSGDTWLYVKLHYHRCIGIKLRPEMDMKPSENFKEEAKVEWNGEEYGDEQWIGVFHLDGDYWEDALAKEIVIGENVNLSIEEIAAKCLWELTFYGFTPEHEGWERLRGRQLRNKFDVMLDRLEERKWRHQTPVNTGQNVMG